MVVLVAKNAASAPETSLVPTPSPCAVGLVATIIISASTWPFVRFDTAEKSSPTLRMCKSVDRPKTNGAIKSPARTKAHSGGVCAASGASESVPSTSPESASKQPHTTPPASRFSSMRRAKNHVKSRTRSLGSSTPGSILA